ncbi:MAG: hypothetical protein Q9173_003110 [Seirophora scorigena]
MADPVSIATGVVGVLTAAAQITSFLINFTRCSEDAPQAAQYILAEVLGTSGTLSQFQSLLMDNAQVDRSRTQLLQVDHVVTIVSACVLTFSELSELLDELKAEGMHTVMARARWARKDKTISKLVQRLQHHKASLTLILNVFNGGSNNIAEAKASVDRLQTTIERHYEEMSSRMEALELREVGRADRVSVYPRSRDDTSSIKTMTSPPPAFTMSDSHSVSSGGVVTSAFTETLQRSWVYRRNNALDPSRSSLDPKDHCSLGWSYLSNVSWAEVSNISVIGLPITTDEVHSSMWSSNGPIDPAGPLSPAVESFLSRGPLVDEEAAIEIPADEPVARALPASHFTRESAPKTEKTRAKGKAMSCKRCGEILNQDVAMGFLGRRWHTDCYRCTKCDTQLNPDSNSSLLDDGSLLCDGCTQTCACCGDPIDESGAVVDGLVFCEFCYMLDVRMP